MKALLPELDRYQKEDKLKRTVVAVQKINVDQIGLQEEGVSMSWQTQLIAKSIWDLAQMHKFVQDEIVESKEFKPIIAELGKFSGSDVHQATAHVHGFAKNCVEPLAKITDEDLNDQIDRLFIEIERPPRIWTVNLWYRGFYLDQPKVDINKDILIRQTIKEDLHREEEIGWNDLFPKPEHTSTVVVIKKIFDNEPDIYEFMEKVSHALLLYKLGSVQPTYTLLETKTLYGRPKVGFPASSAASSYKYKITPKDKVGINSMIELILDKSKSQNIFSNAPDPKNYIAIAIKRYKNALFKSDTYEEKLANLVSSLEAIYSSDSVELRFRLSQRIAILLSHYGFATHDTFDDVKVSYDIRSKYSHGDFIKNPKGKYKDLDALTNRIANYTRIAILTSTQLIGIKSKAEIVGMIDEGMIDKNNHELFMELLKKHCPVFK